MRTLQFLLLLTSLLTLSGCEQDCNVGSGPLPSLPVPPQVVVVGEPATVPVRAMVRGGCPGNWNVDGVPTNLRVELFDPDGLPVEAETALHQEPSSGGNFYFTPQKPGRYHVFTTFEPVGGFNQFDLYAMRDDSAGLPLEKLNWSCEALERTREGWLCNTDFLRGSTVELRFAGNRAAAAGDVVWTVNETRIQRYVDTGTALELTASLDHTLGAAEFLLASADELVILHARTLQRAVFNGTALVSTGTSTWEGSGSTGLLLGASVIPLRRGEQLVLVTSNGRDLQACPYQLEQGRFVRTSARCQAFPGESMEGFEPGVLWLSTPGGGSTTAGLRRLELGENGLVERGSLPLGINIDVASQQLGMRTSMVPVIKTDPINYGSRLRSAVVTYAPTQGTLVLQMLDPDVSDGHASTRLFWGRSSIGTSGELRIRVLPSDP